MAPGLHECPVCHYRFEDEPSLVAHMEACAEDERRELDSRSPGTAI